MALHLIVALVATAVVASPSPRVSWMLKPKFDANCSRDKATKTTAASLNSCEAAAAAKVLLPCGVVPRPPPTSPPCDVGCRALGKPFTVRR